ncbi:MAG TPA: methyl-accepting chemotaxis protein [Roseateles sp.]|nr:methyl-accepting chemotaxis protein [Roseateles sp.]
MLELRPQGFKKLYIACDRTMLGILALAWLLALGLGIHYGQTGLAALLGTLLMALALGAYLLAAGSTASRALITLAQVGMVALHIHLAMGRVEYHFGVFVTLAVLLMYRDWRVLLLAAAAFAVHHIVFDRLLAAGVSAYCLSEPDFPRILLHAGYVVAQTAVQIPMARLMRMRTKEGLELHDLLRVLGQDGGRMGLDVEHVHASTPAGKRIKLALSRLAAALARVQQAARSVDGASAEINSGNRDLSARTEQAANSLQDTASSVQRLSDTVRLTAESASQATQLAHGAAGVARRGGDMMGRVVSTMDEIHAASRKIGDIIGVIDGLAFQTNILALNAAVEAARAGEQGRGFAVVASEVRALAQRSATAAREIKTLIDASLDKVDAGSGLVKDAGGTMAELVESVQRVSALIVEIAQAADEQHQGFARINAAVARLDEMAQGNTALAVRSADAAASLNGHALELNEVAASFRLGRG